MQVYLVSSEDNQYNAVITAVTPEQAIDMARERVGGDVNRLYNFTATLVDTNTSKVVLTDSW